MARHLGQGLGADRVSTLDLGPLERDEGVHLIRQLAPELGAQQAAELWAQAKGSPFWLGILADGGGEHDLAGHIAARLRGLGRDANRLLAPLRSPHVLSELEAIIGWDQSRTEAAMAELERSGLMVVQGVAVGLAHDLIRVSAMSQISASARRELHAQIATFLERQVASVQLLHRHSFIVAKRVLTQTSSHCECFNPHGAGFSGETGFKSWRASRTPADCLSRSRSRFIWL